MFMDWEKFCATVNVFKGNTAQSRVSTALVTWPWYIYCNYMARSSLHFNIPLLGRLYPILILSIFLLLSHPFLLSGCLPCCPHSIPALSSLHHYIIRNVFISSFLSFPPRGVVMGWWVGGYTSGLPGSSGLSNLPPPPSAIQPHKHAVTGKPQPASSFKTQLHWMHIQKCTSNTNQIQENSKKTEK